VSDDQTGERHVYPKVPHMNHAWPIIVQILVYNIVLVKMERNSRFK